MSAALVTQSAPARSHPPSYPDDVTTSAPTLEDDHFDGPSVSRGHHPPLNPTPKGHNPWVGFCKWVGICQSRAPPPKPPPTPGPRILPE